MIRLIKRYGSRKLYDTEESRYASLEEIADWIRAGQEIKVVDNQSLEDVTVQTLGQIIAECGKRGTHRMSSGLLQELIRSGEELWSSGVGQLQETLHKAFDASLGRLAPVRRMREETEVLRKRLEDLEAALAEFEGTEPAPPPADLPAGKKTIRKTRVERPAR